MALRPTVNTAYCILQSSGAPQTFTLSKMDDQQFDGNDGVYAFMVYLVRSMARMVIFITTQLFPLMVCFNYSGSENWSTKSPGSKRVLLLKGAPRRLQSRLRGKQLTHPSLAHAFCFSIVLSVVSVVFVALLLLFNMVRQGGRKRPRGNLDDGSRTSSSSSNNPDHSPANLPPSQVNVQPSSSICRPIPNNAFQTTHFKFQSNLNRPLISAHITLIISEEESQIHPLACIAPEPSQSSEQQLTMGSPEKALVEQTGHIDSTRITLPHVDIFPAEGDEALNDSNHPISIPKDDKVGNEVLCLASDRPAEEKTFGRRKED